MSDRPCMREATFRGKPLRIFHAYKIYRPDIEGGIPAVISCLARDGTASHSIVAARRFGWGQRYSIDDAPVEAVASLGIVVKLGTSGIEPAPALARRSVGL